ncbi:FAD dependent oxidoreductase [Biscogniauxia mediterranea]|nr:FAD dependent oxidoreductase [Biscogniauxia mediterranea]
MNDHSTKSYWHKEPSAKLLGHRTTPDLPRAADVAIVGSGITGAFAAHFLREKRPDLNIVMVDAREACWGATGRNGGHCQPAMYMPEPHISSFELRTFSFLKGFVEQHSIPCDWHTTSGVHAYYSAELFARAREKIARLAETYPDVAANVAVVTKGAESESTPAWLLPGERRELTLEALRVPAAEGAVVQWNAASLWPYKLVAFVLERLLLLDDDDDNDHGSEKEKRGGGGGFNLQTNTPVTGLTRAETPSGTMTTTTTTTWTLHTPRGTLTARQVLLATNGYTAHLLPALADLIVPTRGQVAALKPPTPPSSSSSELSTAPPPLDIGHTFYFMGEPDAPYERDDYLVQRPPPPAGDGELIFGGGRRHAPGRGVGVSDDSTVDEAVAWYLRGELSGMMDLSPSAPEEDQQGGKKKSNEKEKEEKEIKKTKNKKQDLDPTHEWTGIMGYTRDGYPLVGRVPGSLGGDDDDKEETEPPASSSSLILDTKEGSSSSARRDVSGGGLWLCAGYSGHGMPNAALCARAVVDMMCGEPEIDLPPEYELTAPRAALARARREEVAVADARGSLFGDFGMTV